MARFLEECCADCSAPPLPRIDLLARVVLLVAATIGLPKASVARLLTVVAIDARLVHHSIGLLSAPDRATVAAAVERLGIDIAGQLRLA